VINIDGAVSSVTNDNSFTWTNQSGARAGRGGSVVGRDQVSQKNNFGNPGGNSSRSNDERALRQTGADVDGKTRILLLAANPSSTPRLAVDEEAREINEKLRLAQNRDSFELITCWAVRPALIRVLEGGPAAKVVGVGLSWRDEGLDCFRWSRRAAGRSGRTAGPDRPTRGSGDAFGGFVALRCDWGLIHG
jgi:hypothetical protein